MPLQTYHVSEDVHIEIRDCRERVSVSGWNDAQTVNVDSPARLEGNTLSIEKVKRVSLRVPRAAKVTISHCEADIRLDDLAGRVELERIEGDVVLRNQSDVIVRDLEGDLVAKGVMLLQGEGTWEGDAALRAVEQAQIKSIEGDASLGDIGTMSLENLEGDLSIRDLRGQLRLGTVEGDVALREIAGDVNMAHGEGDFVLSGMHGSLDAPEIDGDAVVSLAEVKDVTLRAQGDVVLTLPNDADANIELDAPHGDVVAGGAIHVVKRDDNYLRGTIGKGGPSIRVESLGDDIVVRTGREGSFSEQEADFAAPFVGLGQEFAEMGRRIAEETRQSVEESMSNFNMRREHRHHHFHRSHRDPSAGVSEEPPSEASGGLAPGSPERKAVLDAIARGEISVDEAIKKINGEV